MHWYSLTVLDKLQIISLITGIDSYVHVCKYINMSDNDIIKSVFEDCSFEESIIKNCKLNKVIFNSINFNLSNIYNTKLKDIDLSSCNLRNIYSDLNSIKGSIIEPYQAMDLIPLLEVKIRSKYENN